MKFISSLTVAKKLALSFGVLCLLTLATAWAAVWGVSRTGAAADQLYSGGTVHLRILSEIHYLATRSRVLLMDAQLQKKPEGSKKRLGQFDEATKRIHALLEEARATDMSGDDRLLFRQVESTYKDLLEQGLQSMAGFIRSDNYDDAMALGYKAISALNPAFTDAIEKSLGNQVRDATSGHEAAAAVALRATNTSVATAVFALVAATLGSVWLTRDLTRSLGAEPAELAQVAQRIAAGSLVDSPKVPAPPGSVMASMQSMRASLASLVAQVKAGAQGVTHASTEIAQGNLDLSGRTELQATNLQQTAASMEELGSTIRVGAGHAHQASQLAKQASATVSNGGAVVEQVVQTMSDIRAASSRISDITGLIDSIAFQTNILALNAAVEAARAGEQGRGFAVVAQEVRMLAKRSGDAAKQIKTLIGASVHQIESGDELARKAGQSMAAVMTQVRQVAELIDEVSCAAAEQSQEVSQVSSAVAQLDQTTQQNASLVEQSSAAAVSLREQARKLVDSISAFHLGEATDAERA